MQIREKNMKSKPICRSLCQIKLKFKWLKRTKYSYWFNLNFNETSGKVKNMPHTVSLTFISNWYIYIMTCKKQFEHVTWGNEMFKTSHTVKYWCCIANCKISLYLAFYFSLVRMFCSLHSINKPCIYCCTENGSSTYLTMC